MPSARKDTFKEIDIGREGKGRMNRKPVGLEITQWTFAVGLMVVLLLPCLAVRAETVRVWRGSIAIPTYQLGPADPNPPFPLVNPNPVYPYAMLDDLTDRKSTKSYQALYLENKYLKITILPQLGGHVYSVYDKVDRREVLYRNNVVKYGLVGPRGAWISGGMEFSFPFAHTTDTVSPVESTLRHNADGSATVLVGAMDWVSSMYWQIAITLRPETARVEEGVTLYNATPLKHLYLFWTNTAVKATDDLQYIYPMRETISDDPFAIVQSWPVWKGVDQSWYKNNPSAMAIFARDVHRNYFGVYYHHANYGVVHVADFRQDPGKKLWSWGTAPSGTIWDHILSDNDGPYNEIQSGRFYTQGYREFMNPRRVDKWTEYWYPVRGLDGGFVEATSQMAINVADLKDRNGQPQSRLTISPAADVADATIQIKQGSSVLREYHHVNLTALQPAAYTVPVQSTADAHSDLNVVIRSAQGKTLLHWSSAAPIDGNPNFVPSAGSALRQKLESNKETPVEALYLQAMFLEKRGDTKSALQLCDEILKRDPGYIPALIQEALYHYRAADFQKAERFIAIAIRRNDEDPEVLYVAGIVHRAEGRLSSAKDAFWKSIHYGDSLLPGHALAPSFVELGEMEMLQQNYAKAIELFQRALAYNKEDAFARTDLAAAERLSGNIERAAKDSANALENMPLLPYALAEHWQDQIALSSPQSNTGETWMQIVANDPQNYIAIASRYHEVGAWKSSDAVLHIALKNFPAQNTVAMANYYLASNARHEGDLQQAKHYATKAASLSIAETFPNRMTDAAVLTEAVQHNPADAHAKYALGNFLFAHARYDDAAALWEQALSQGFENPVLLRNLGVYRWLVKKDLAGAAGYYSRAIRLSPNDYRLYTDLDKIHEAQGKNDVRAELFRNAPMQVLDQDTVQARMALLDLETSRPEQALALFSHRTFKPWEGGTVVHNMFVMASIEKGKRALTKNQPEQAERAFRQAMLYPENLGTGEPFHPDLAEQYYWLGTALAAQGKRTQAVSAWQRSAAYRENGTDTSAVFSALAERKLGKNGQAEQILARCEHAAALPDANANSLYSCGLAEQYTGQPEIAASHFHRALQIDPLLWQARVALNDLGRL